MISSDVYQKQGTVLEFLSLEREPPINIAKRLKKVLWRCCNTVNCKKWI